MQLYYVHVNFPHHEYIVAILDPFLATLRRPALYAHNSERPAGSVYPVRLRPPAEARDILAEEVLLLQ